MKKLLIGLLVISSVPAFAGHAFVKNENRKQSL
jgi:hypothetical protein